jgi:hypothetical protein
VVLVAVAADPRSTPWKPSLVIVLRLIGVLQKIPMKCWTRAIEHVSAMISGGLWRTRNVRLEVTTMMIVGPDALESHTT